MTEDLRVLSIYPMKSGVGATTTTLLLAEAISQLGKKVIVLDFDLTFPTIHLYAGSKDTLHNIDNVIPYAISGTLNEKVIENNIQKFRDFHYLRGTSAPVQSIYIEVDSLNKIIEVCKEIYDYVLIDLGAEINNPGTYSAMSNSDKILSVSDKNVISVQLYEMVRDTIKLNFPADKFGLIVTKDSENIDLKNDDIVEYTGLPLVLSIHNLGEGFLNVVNQGKFDFELAFDEKLGTSLLSKLQRVVDDSIEVDAESENQSKEQRKFSLFGKNK